MKKLLCALLAAVLLCGCTAAPAGTTGPATTTQPPEIASTVITLSDEGIEFPADSGIHVANDIVYYEEGRDETYGEGEAHESHSAAEAAKHTVVHITKPGTYTLRGKLSAGQIAVDLGEEAKTDPNAVVTLILDGADITCTVAPAVIFYNVYECGNPEDPRANVDTAAAGANVVLHHGSVNNITGSHVAKIYKPGTDKKLHKYDAAFYSKMSMNIGGSGELNITADDEGLDTELHLTINGGTIRIASGNDGINTNADGVSVTTINGGLLDIHVTGETGEGDGIDSNGWLVINGGWVFASACGISGDAGIDSDMGIQINGGTVCASGNMLDRIEDGGQTHVVFTFSNRQEPGTYTLKNAKGEEIIGAYHALNGFQYLILSSPELTEGTYTLWSGDTQFRGAAGQSGGFFGNMQPIERPDWPGRDDGADVEIPPQPSQPVYTQGQQPPPGEQPADMPVPPMPEDGTDMPVPPMPEGTENMPTPPQPPQSGRDSIVVIPSTLSAEFPIRQGANYFYALQPME